MAKKNMTVNEVAKKLGKTPVIAYGFLQCLEATGRVTVSGTVDTGKRGRPEKVYKVDPRILDSVK